MNGTDPRHDEPPHEPLLPQTNQHAVVDSRDLFRGRRELRISHEGEVYRLLVTRNGRLILNK
jgi:hemin uptake protein HemP